MMQMTKEQFERAVSLNDKMYEKDPDAYEMMVKLSIIQALAYRIGDTETLKKSRQLYDCLEKEMRKGL